MDHLLSNVNRKTTIVVEVEQVEVKIFKGETAAVVVVTAEEIVYLEAI